jgi:hypothetical protein
VGEIRVLWKDKRALWLVSCAFAELVSSSNTPSLNSLRSCRSSSIPSGYAACDCRGLPGGPPALPQDTRSIKTLEKISEDNLDTPSSDVSGNCSPGTYQCRQPFVLGDLQVCGSDGIWQISDHCCGPYTCYDPPGDEQPHCQCSPKSGILDARKTNIVREVASAPVRDSGTYACLESPDGLSLLVNCGVYRTWHVSANCGTPDSCRSGADGSSYCEPGVAHRDEVLTAGIALGCEPGTYACFNGPVYKHWIWVCGPERLWQLSSDCGTPNNCVNGAVPGTAYCEPKGASHDETRAVDTPKECNVGDRWCFDRPDAEILWLCEAYKQWHVAVNCGKPGSCQEGDILGKAFCHTPRTLDPMSSPRNVDPSAGTLDPDEPELCTPGRFTCGDKNSNIYTCNIKGSWVFSYKCSSEHACIRGQNHAAYCVGISDSGDKTASGSADRVADGSGKGFSTLLTVAKGAAASTAMA